MKNTPTQSIKKIYLNYYVMFSAELPKEPYSPVVNVNSDSAVGPQNLHGFDPEVEPVLPGLWYCLHLPRNGFDTMDLLPEVIANGYWVPHGIYLVPSYITADETAVNAIRQHQPTLVITDDTCFKEATDFSTSCRVPLGVARISDLSSASLKQHWTKISELMRDTPFQDAPLDVQPELLPESYRSALPLTFIANQYGWTKQVLERMVKSDFSLESQLYNLTQIRAFTSSLVKLETQGVKKPSQQTLDRMVSTTMQKTRVPVVITIPGVAKRRGSSKSTLTNMELPTTENTAIELIGAHTACARSGVWVPGEPLPPWLFTELHKLESHARGSRSKNHYVWETLKGFGEFFAEYLGEIGPTLIHRASELKIFSDFPIGLSILPGFSDPLSSIIPLSYTPLTPLTRTLQNELPRTLEHYIGHRLKVMIAECLGPNDKIRKLSDAGWKSIISMFESNSNVEVVYRDTQSIDELKNFIHEHGKTDILVVSAHGVYDPKGKVAGLYIGNNVWLADDNDVQVPPIVILSACHVAPRGQGAVTISDLLFRLGARVILGTLVPVDVRKNAILTGRLFTYILEAMQGGAQFRSLNQAWQFVVASNAVHEILASSTRLEVWAHTRKPGKLSPIEDFKLNASTDRLRLGHIYQDTFEILCELGDRDGLRPHLEAVKATRGFFPESCFYVLLGDPERVVLSDPVLKENAEQGIKQS